MVGDRRGAILVATPLGVSAVLPVSALTVVDMDSSAKQLGSICVLPSKFDLFHHPNSKLFITKALQLQFIFLSTVFVKSC